MPLCEKTLKMAHRKLTVVVHRSHSILFMPLSSDYTLLSAPKHFSTQTWSAINFTVVQNKSSAHFCIILIMQFLFFVICSKYCNNPSSRLSREIPFAVVTEGGRTRTDVGNRVEDRLHNSRRSRSAASLPGPPLQQNNNPRRAAACDKLPSFEPALSLRLAQEMEIERPSQIICDVGEICGDVLHVLKAHHTGFAVSFDSFDFEAVTSLLTREKISYSSTHHLKKSFTET